MWGGGGRGGRSDVETESVWKDDVGMGVGKMGVCGEGEGGEEEAM